MGRLCGVPLFWRADCFWWGCFAVSRQCVLQVCRCLACMWFPGGGVVVGAYRWGLVPGPWAGGATHGEVGAHPGLLAAATAGRGHSQEDEGNGPCSAAGPSVAATLEVRLQVLPGHRTLSGSRRCPLLESKVAAAVCSHSCSLRVCACAEKEVPLAVLPPPSLPSPAVAPCFCRPRPLPVTARLWRAAPWPLRLFPQSQP